MGWRKIEAEIEGIRDEISADPDAAAAKVRRLLRSGKATPTDQIRLYAIQIRIGCHRGDLAAAMQAYSLGLKLVQARDRGRAELFWAAAELFARREDLPVARELVERALTLLRPLLRDPEELKPGASKRMAHTIRASYAAALVMRADFAFNFSRDRRVWRQGLEDGLEALQFANPRYSRRVHLAAVSVTGLLTVRIGTFADVKRTLDLVHDVLRLLTRRRYGQDHPVYLQFEGLKALVLARLGCTVLATDLLEKVIGRFKAKGLEDEAKWAAHSLVWVVGEREARFLKAQRLQAEYGLEVSPLRSRPRATGTSAPLGW